MLRSPLPRGALFVTLCVTVLASLTPIHFPGAQAHTRAGLTASPQITYTQTSMAVGTPGSTTISLQAVPGYPFDPNTLVSVSIGGASQTTLTTNAQGLLPSNSITVPTYPVAGGAPQLGNPLAGPVPVSVVELNPPGGVSPAPSASIDFYAINTSSPSASAIYRPLYVSSSQNAPGGTLQLSGTGFATGATVTISLLPVTGTGAQQLGTTSANAGGSASFTATIPSVPNGLYFVIASGAGPEPGSPLVSGVGAISVGPGPLTLAVTPGIALPGQALQVSGCDFLANSSLTITVIAPAPPYATQYTAGTPPADANGCFSLNFTLPSSLSAGNFFVQASGASGTTTLVQYGQFVLTPAVTAGVSLVATPSTVVPGAQIQVQGSGFSANVAVTVTAFGANIPASTNASGSFTVSITVPLNAGFGSQTLTATDSANHFTTATVTVGTSSGTLSVTQPSALAGQQVFISGTGFGDDEQVIVSLAPASANPSPITNTGQSFTATANGAISGLYQVPAVQPGTYILLALGQTSQVRAITPFTVAGSTTPTPIPTNTMAPPTAVLPSPTPFATATALSLPSLGGSASTTYFAEGYTGTAAVNGKATFTERLYLYNNGPDASSVTTTYYVYGPGTAMTSIVEHESLQPGQTTVRDVNADVGNNRNVSAVVQSSAGVVAETVISRVAANGGVLDTGSSTGSPSLSQTWYLAEGYTGASFQEYLLLFNPSAQAVTASVRYLPSGTAAPPAQQVQIPAGGRATINVRQVYNGLEKKGSSNVAIMVTADHPIAVDRSMYWGAGSGSGKYGYSIGPGIPTGSTSQSFAYLPTANGSQSFVTVLNPSPISATVTLSLQDVAGAVINAAQAVVPSMQRSTFSVPSILAGSYSAIVGTLTSNTVPVVAEAGVYFGGSPNIGNHPGLVLQGTEGGHFGARASVAPNGATIRVYNPTNLPERVQISLADSSGVSILSDATLFGQFARTLIVPAGAGPRGISVVSTGAVTADLINGGDNSPIAYGGNLN